MSVCSVSLQYLGTGAAFWPAAAEGPVSIGSRARCYPDGIGPETIPAYGKPGQLVSSPPELKALDQAYLAHSLLKSATKL